MLSHLPRVSDKSKGKGKNIHSWEKREKERGTNYNAPSWRVLQWAWKMRQHSMLCTYFEESTTIIYYLAQKLRRVQPSVQYRLWHSFWGNIQARILRMTNRHISRGIRHLFLALFFRQHCCMYYNPYSKVFRLFGSKTKGRKFIFLAQKLRANCVVIFRHVFQDISAQKPRQHLHKNQGSLLGHFSGLR